MFLSKIKPPESAPASVVSDLRSLENCSNHTSEFPLASAVITLGSLKNCVSHIRQNTQLGLQPRKICSFIRWRMGECPQSSPTRPTG